MQKILAGTSTKFKAEATRKPLRWISLATVSALALGFSALPLSVTNGHVNLNPAKAAQNGKGGTTTGGGGGGPQGPGGGLGGQGPSTSGGGGGGQGSGNPGGGGPEGSFGGGSMGPSESRGGDKGRDVPSSETPSSIERPDAPALGRPDTGPGRGNGTDNAGGRGNDNTPRGNDVVSGSGKGFTPGPAQGRGVNELTSPLFSAPTAGKGKGSSAPAKADGSGKPSGRAVDTAATANIQQRVGDQSGPDLDSNAEAALIERGWKR